MTDTTKSFLTTANRVLLRCWLIGMGVLLVWVGFYLALGQKAYQVHGRLFHLTAHDLNMLAYAGMMLWKMLVLALFFLPWLAIRLVLRQAENSAS